MEVGEYEAAAQRCIETGFRIGGREGLALIRLADRYRKVARGSLTGRLNPGPHARWMEGRRA